MVDGADDSFAVVFSLGITQESAIPLQIYVVIAVGSFVTGVIATLLAPFQVVVNRWLWARTQQMSSRTTTEVSRSLCDERIDLQSALDWDDVLPEAPYEFDWRRQFELALESNRTQAYHDRRARPKWRELSPSKWRR